MRRSELCALCECALREGRMDDLMDLLRRRTQLFSPGEAWRLCSLAMTRADCTRAVLECLLDSCPPLEEVQRGQFGLGPLACLGDRAELLDVLLRRGINPNGPGGEELSILERAVWERSVSCAARLLEEPDLDLTVTESMLHSWSRMYQRLSQNVSRERDGRLLRALPLLAEGDRAGAIRALRTPARLSRPEDLPLPRGLTAVHAAALDSWDLLIRICRQRGALPAEEALRALRRISPKVWGDRNMFQAIDALFAACPRLLRRRYGRRLLTLACLDEGSGAQLRHWIPQLRTPYVTLWPLRGSWGDWTILERCWDWAGNDGGLEKWRERMGNTVRPALSRHCPLPEAFRLRTGEDAGGLKPETVEAYFRHCAVLGRPRPGRLSPLAEDVLRWGPPNLAMRLFSPGGPLGDEDPEPLLAFALSDRCPSGNRAHLLAMGSWKLPDPYAL